MLPNKVATLLNTVSPEQVTFTPTAEAEVRAFLSRASVEETQNIPALVHVLRMSETDAHGNQTRVRGRHVLTAFYSPDQISPDDTVELFGHEVVLTLKSQPEQVVESILMDVQDGVLVANITPKNTQ